MKHPIVNRDPGDETQTTIYESPGYCPQLDCLTGRRNLCRWEADRANGATYTPRPDGCIAAPDPQTDPIPF